MRRVHLRVLLPTNRNYTGHLRVEIDGVAVGEFRVLGRGSRGPGNTWFLEDGDTPTGTYDGSTFLSTAGQKRRSYGPWGKVALKPLRGNALVAESVFNRKELRIHGGDPGAWFGPPGSAFSKGTLRPTHGCLRLSDADMKHLRDMLIAAGYDSSSASCVQPEVTVTVSE
jgi:hypothetical protein